jgi:hypothetical protein
MDAGGEGQKRNGTFDCTSTLPGRLLRPTLPATEGEVKICKTAPPLDEILKPKPDNLLG